MQLSSAVSSFRTACSAYGATPDDMQAAIEAFTYENPNEYSVALNLVRVSGSGSSVTASFTYNQCDQRLFEEKLTELVNIVTAKIGYSGDDYSICKAVYDSILKGASAANDVQNEFLSMGQRDEQAIAQFIEQHGVCFTAYGPIVNKKGTCEGYSMAFKMLLDRFGVECAIAAATGTAQDASGNDVEIDHVLNVVEIGGRRYYVDLTHGLPIDGMPMIRYDLFLATEEQVRQHTVPSRNWECNFTQDSYFVKSRTQFSSTQQVRNYLSSCTYVSTNGEIRFRYTGKMNDNFLGELFDYVISNRCGAEYRVQGYVITNGVCNALLQPR